MIDGRKESGEGRISENPSIVRWGMVYRRLKAYFSFQPAALSSPKVFVSVGLLVT